MLLMPKLIAIAMTVVVVSPAWSVEVGRKAAAKYFTSKGSADEEATSPGRAVGENYLALQVGQFTQSDAYGWGEKGKVSRTGKSSFGLSYLIEEASSFDTWLRMEYNTFEISEEKPTKLSVLPLWTFPRVSTLFPIYFGAGAGLGIFFKQVKDRSNLSLDYELLAGLRWANAFEGVGFLFETGIRNHLHLLSEGQMNGTFWQVGVLFNF